MKSSKKTSSSGRNKISDAKGSYFGVSLPPQKKGSFLERKKEKSDRCYDFTNDHTINPPKDKSKK